MYNRTITLSIQLSDEEIKLLEKARSMPITFDKDCPKTTPERVFGVWVTLRRELYSSLGRFYTTRMSKRGDNMLDEKIIIQDSSEMDPNLLRMLDRGLEDIEAGRTVPHDDAMAEIRRNRESRRCAKSKEGVAINA